MYCRSEKSPLPQKRITNIIEYLTYEVFTYSVRGLYENHKFLFVLLMTLKIDLQRGTVKHREFQALIKGEGVWMMDVTERISLSLCSLYTDFYSTLEQLCYQESEALYAPLFLVSIHCVLVTQGSVLRACVTAMTLSDVVN